MSPTQRAARWSITAARRVSFLRRLPTLLIAVPLTAVAGLAVLGVLALVCAAVIAAFQGDAAAGDALSNLIPNSWPGRRRRK